MRGPARASRAIVLALLALPAIACSNAGSSAPPLATAELEHGRDLFLHDCVPCHGEAGRGDGPVARSQPTPPRDFVAGAFKLTSGPPGSLPSDDDLLHTITYGVATSTMPSFAMLDLADRKALVQYVKSLSPRYRRAAR